jgi:enoyl-CoA hydratase
MAYQTLIVERDGPTAIVTINRPQALNALNQTVLDELAAVFDALESDASVRAVIVTGAGDRAFVAGADIAELAALPNAEAATRKARAGHKVTERMEHSRLPVIMAINGFALGGGLELAMAGDIRVAATTAKLGQPEVNLGIIGGFGGTQRLPRLVGQGMASYLLLTGEMIGADEAKQAGLVEKVVPPEQLMTECKRLASVIASKGPRAVALTKQVIHKGLQTDLHAALEIEAEAFGSIATTNDAREGTRAFLEKRAPTFTGT